MVEEVKKIKVEEITDKIEKYKLEEAPSKKFSLIQRKFLKRKEFYKYIKEYHRRLEELELKQSSYKEAKSFLGLYMDFNSSLELLKQKGITPVLTANDLLSDEYIESTKSQDSLEGLVLIHKTRYVPKNKKIASTKESVGTKEIKIKIAKETIIVKISNPRNTVHFSVNGEVVSHMLGDWEDCKYAVIIPFTDIKKEQYANVYPNDTYTIGGVELTSNSWILVPRGESEKVKKENPGVNVMEYEGQDVSGYANILIKYLGYSKEIIDPGRYGGWSNKEHKYKFIEFMKREGFRTGTHWDSKEREMDLFDEFKQKIIQIIKYVEEHKELMHNEDFVKSLKEELTWEIVEFSKFPNEIEYFQLFYEYMLEHSYALTLSSCDPTVITEEIIRQLEERCQVETKQIKK